MKGTREKKYLSLILRESEEVKLPLTLGKRVTMWKLMVSET